MRRIYFPADYAGLSHDEKCELEELQLTRADYDALRRRIGYGDLCASLIHLRRAEAILRTAEPEKAVRIANVAAVLSNIVPSYLDSQKKAQ